MRRRLWAFALLLMAIVLSFLAFAAQPQLQEAFVRDVRDGDTIEVVFPDDAREGIRYEGISAPELDACFGEEARTANEDSVLQKDVWLEMNPQGGDFERGRNRRILAYVWLDPERSDSVQVRLVEAGYALLDARNVKDEDVNQDPTLFPIRYAERILESQISAAGARRGWWADCDPYGDSGMVVAAVKHWGSVETVYILNRGEDPIDLGPGWALWDDSGSSRNHLEFNRITGPSCILPPGGLLRVHSGRGIPEEQRKTNTPCNEEEIDIYWTGNRVWDNGGDKAKLFSPDGILIYEYTYPPFGD